MTEHFSPLQTLTIEHDGKIGQRQTLMEELELMYDLILNTGETGDICGCKSPPSTTTTTTLPPQCTTPLKLKCKIFLIQ